MNREEYRNFVREMSNEELLEIVMSYSDKPGKLPAAGVIEDNMHSVYDEVLERHDSFRDWADEIGYFANKAKKNYWTDTRIIQRMSELILQLNGMPDQTKDIRNYKEGPFFGLYDAANGKSKKGFQYYRVHALKHLLESGRKLPDKEISYLRHGKQRGELSKDTSIKELLEHVINKVGEGKKPKTKKGA